MTNRHHPSTKLYQALILVLLAWHFAGILLWLSPACALRDELIPPFLGYLNFFGFWQGWSVFEKPRTYNAYLTAVITRQDGSQATWEFPRMEKLSIIDKMFKERYRRWTNDCVSDPNMSYLWPDAVRYIARLYRCPDNQPVSVSIVRHWIWIDSPAVGLDKPLRTADDGQQILCTCAISAKDLE
jgi:hypothetical protein